MPGTLSLLQERAELRIRHRDNLVKSYLAAEIYHKPALMGQIRNAHNSVIIVPSEEREVYSRIGSPWLNGVPDINAMADALDSTSSSAVDSVSESNNDEEESVADDNSHAASPSYPDLPGFIEIPGLELIDQKALYIEKTRKKRLSHASNPAWLDALVKRGDVTNTSNLNYSSAHASLTFALSPPPTFCC